MKIIDIFGSSYNHVKVQPLLDLQIETIRSQCSDFINESEGLPAYKKLPKNVNFTKLKARTRKRTDSFSESFNNALVPNLRQRAIYAHGSKPKLNENEGGYYIFPINGYKYVFNECIQDSSIYENVYRGVNDSELFTELLQHNYTNDHLVEGLESGAEILFHSIPYVYAINVDVFPSYNQLLSAL